MIIFFVNYIILYYILYLLELNFIIVRKIIGPKRRNTNNHLKKLR